MTDEIEVVLTGPAKIRDTVKRPGDKVRVTDAEREQLRAAGVLAEDAAALIENADADLNAAVVDWQARALSAEAQLKLLEARVIELQGGPLPVAEDQDAPPLSGTEDSLEPVQAGDQAEAQPAGEDGALIEEDPAAEQTPAKAGRGKAKG
ncbi:hypothetical protein FBT96_12480 [Rhodobacter capsulatus]|uniref:Uncharacterized protein n=1 Tax=Rhodobacter capsulatus TaxID=1061 RepID=A0A4U1JQ42_RHOCA|nr:hypothetical protein [Rhodobacter capsulatus]TKD17953.1 hypothetical protein FBT96_12480 [Rhodobacter capsulatus]